MALGLGGLSFLFAGVVGLVDCLTGADYFGSSCVMITVEAVLLVILRLFYDRLEY